MTKNVLMPVNFTRKVAQNLRELSARHDTTITNVVNNAVHIYKYLSDAQMRGAVIHIIEKNGETNEMELL